MLVINRRYIRAKAGLAFNRSLGSVIKPIAVNSIVNMEDFIEKNRALLKPPVSNCLLYSGTQLKIMIVGGPNERDDFHLEEGEEFFYQLSGNMNLDVMQLGKRTRLPILQGQIFILPPKIPHSPQRYSNTIGLVIERARAKSEADVLRWYLPKSNRILYQETFHCTDLGTQIKSVIERFMAMSESKLLHSAQEQPIDSKYAPAEPEPLIATPMPALLTQLIASKSTPSTQNPINLLNSEFVVDLYRGGPREVGAPLRSMAGQEVFLLQIAGQSKIVTAAGCESEQSFSLAAGQVCLLSGSTTDRCVRQRDTDDSLVTISSKKAF